MISCHAATQYKIPTAVVDFINTNNVCPAKDEQDTLQDSSEDEDSSPSSTESLPKPSTRYHLRAVRSASQNFADSSDADDAVNGDDESGQDLSLTLLLPLSEFIHR